MDGWGEKMLATVSTVAEVVACGLGLASDAFTSRMQLGPHLLAPTGAPLAFQNSKFWNLTRQCYQWLSVLLILCQALICS